MSPRLVLNTRPREQAIEASRLLTAAGFVSIEAPAIEIVPAWDEAELSAVREVLRAGSFDWVILASKNAARAIRAELDASTAQLVCGVATARALGIRPAVGLQRFSAGAALDAIRPLIAPGDRVLLPRAADGRDELLDGLRQLGASLTAPIAYRTITVEYAARRLAHRDIDVVTVCSPSAVTSLAPAVTTERLVCLGRTTAAAARAASLRVDAVAESTSMSALVTAVQSLTPAENLT